MRIPGDRDLQRTVALRLQRRISWQSGWCNISLRRRYCSALVPLATLMDLSHDKTTLDIQIASDDRSCHR